MWVMWYEWFLELCRTEEWFHFFLICWIIFLLLPPSSQLLEACEESRYKWVLQDLNSHLAPAFGNLGGGGIHRIMAWMVSTIPQCVSSPVSTFFSIPRCRPSITRLRLLQLRSHATRRSAAMFVSCVCPPQSLCAECSLRRLPDSQ